MSQPPPPGTGPAGQALPPLPASACEICGNVSPPGPYCGICGAHRAHPADALAARRPHAYTAFPEEPVLRLSVVTSLFPHLSQRATRPFRAGVAALVALLVVMAATGVEPSVVALAALGLPLLFELYVLEADVYEEHRLGLSAATLLGGLALGTGWALVGGPVVAEALAPQLGHSLGAAQALLAAVVVPAVGQVLMCFPLLAVLAVLPTLRTRRESLDGFVLGAAGALGFTCAAIITDLAGNLGGGVVQQQPFVASLTEALVRGISEPLVAAAGTGLVGAALWSRGGEEGMRRRLLLPAAALVAVVAIQVGLGCADQARLADVALLAVHLAVAALLLLALRAGLHHIVLAERHGVRIGPPLSCPHCHHVVPELPFCPACGVARAATSKRNRRQAAAAADEAAAWPLLPAGSAASFAGYPLAVPDRSPAAERAHHLRLVAAFLGGLALLIAALLVTAAVSSPPGAPRRRCVLVCIESGRPFGTASSPLRLGPLGPAAGFPAATPATARPGRGGAAPAAGVQSFGGPAGGFSVAMLLGEPGDNPGLYPSWRVSRSGDLLTIELPSSSGRLGGKAVTIDGGTIQFAGLEVGDQPAESVVDGLVSSNAPSAWMDYPLPDPLVGYQAGYGAVYDDVSPSSSGSARTERLVVCAAVENGYAVVVWASGPKDASFPQSPLVLHPSFVDLDVSLVLDPMINSVTWARPAAFGG